METHIIVALSLTLLILLFVTWKDRHVRHKLGTLENLLENLVKALPQRSQINALEKKINVLADLVKALPQRSQINALERRFRQEINVLADLVRALPQDSQRDVFAEIVLREINVLANVARHTDVLEEEIFQLESVRSALADHDPYIAFRSPPRLHKNNPYWEALSYWIRKEKQWTCEKCDIDLKDRQSDLHAHHILGRGFNSPQHLKVLCIECHAEELNHEFMKKHPEYKAFLKWRRSLN